MHTLGGCKRILLTSQLNILVLCTCCHSLEISGHCLGKMHNDQLTDLLTDLM